MKLLLTGFLVGCAIIFQQASFADDVEDDNDTAAGAEAIIAPARRTAYTITATDADWFSVKKGYCNELTVTMTPIGGENDVYSLELYNPASEPPGLITAKSGFGSNRIDLSIAATLDVVLVRVYGEDVTGSSLYEVNFEIADVNAPIRKEIEKLGRVRDRMTKRLANLEKRNAPKQQIARLKRDIKEAEAKIKKLRARLCV